jgi:hypothetical protein
VYDAISPLFTSPTIDARFTQLAYTTRNRVSYTQYFNQYSYVADGSPDILQYDHASYYSYDDIHGNVAQLLHDYRTGTLASFGFHRTKLISYQYDLISGKVNRVAYNPGYADQFYHRYTYDAENRLTNVHPTTHPLLVGNLAVADHEARLQQIQTQHAGLLEP